MTAPHFVPLLGAFSRLLALAHGLLAKHPDVLSAQIVFNPVHGWTLNLSGAGLLPGATFAEMIDAADAADIPTGYIGRNRQATVLTFGHGHQHYGSISFRRALSSQ